MEQIVKNKAVKTEYYYVNVILKTVLAMIIAYMIFRASLGREAMLWAAVGAVAGHNYPFRHRFHGGKGVTATLTSLILLFLLWGIPASVIGGVVTVLTGDLWLGAILIPLLAAPFTFIYSGAESGIVVLIMLLMMIQKNLSGVIKILTGEEHRRFRRKQKKSGSERAKMKLNDYECEHLTMLRPRLAECTVLLKKNGVFPLEEPCRIAAYGNGVRNTLKGGTGSGEVNSRFSVSIEQGLTDAGFTLTSGVWLDAYELERAKAKKAFVKEIRTKAKQQHTMAVLIGMGAVMPEPEYDLPISTDSDAAVYVLARICGEGSDRKTVPGDLLLTETEIRDILALNRAYPKFMLVLNTGGPVDLSPVMEVGNILLLSQLGVETGAVLADILLGKADPGGRLAATWAAAGDTCPDLNFGGMDDTCYNEGIYVGYRYFDTVGKKPLFPFGYGLSYTTFETRCERVEAVGSMITLHSAVTNTGRFPGSQVVQVYVSSPEGKLGKPFQDLAGFARTKVLQPGQVQQVAVTFDLCDLACFDTESSSYVLEQGDYIIRIGTGSTDTAPCAKAKLVQTAVVKTVRRITTDGVRDKRYTGRAQETISADLPCLIIEPEDIPCMKTPDPWECEISAEAKALTDEDLAALGIGLFNQKGGLLNMIGCSGQSVCGAAGETTNLLGGVSALVMADGPAGLRLTRRYYKDRKGMHPVGEAGLPMGMQDYLPAPLQWLTRKLTGSRKVPAGAKIKEQYATALPIASAIAQSWDTDLAALCGDIVGDEMDRFGVHLWLAPALNIQRSALCGRNFEYYSEDPLISGKMAAAVTRGVQCHPGRGVTVKHFAANNQELNRVNNNSRVSERALREIYLKGFAVCIRESAPHALMTSYNLLNGVHTAEHRGLIYDFLRCECGFRGIVMTDWIVKGSSAVKHPKYAQTTAPAIASAGGNLMMPGSGSDYNELLNAIKTTPELKQQAQKNASLLLSKIRELTVAAEHRNTV